MKAKNCLLQPRKKEVFSWKNKITKSDVADPEPHHFGEPDPDQHQSEKPDPDPDPDPHDSQYLDPDPDPDPCQSWQDFP
jgi:hypothetical protein